MPDAKNTKDKERSRQQSRAVGGGSGKQRPPRPGRPTAAPPPPIRSRSTVVTWAVVGIVVAVVLGLIIVKFSSGSGQAAVNPAPGPLPVAVEHEMTSIGTNVFNTVGITAPAYVELQKPTVKTGQGPLKAATGKPEVFYMGAEYCPYCAATRWAIVGALSRFGTFTGLQTMQSSATDAYKDTPTVTFVTSTFKSSYIAFDSKEVQSNQAAATGKYTTLQPLNSTESSIVSQFSTSGSYPFIDIGDKVFYKGSAYSPSILANLTRTTLAKTLANATYGPTQAIVASANYISAGICSIDNEQPTSVCTSAGVTKADQALKLPS